MRTATFETDRLNQLAREINALQYKARCTNCVKKRQALKQKIRRKEQQYFKLSCVAR